MSERQAAIEGFTKEMIRLWSTGNDDDFTQAQYLNEKISELENMTDEEFMIQYPPENIILGDS